VLFCVCARCAQIPIRTPVRSPSNKSNAFCTVRVRSALRALRYRGSGHSSCARAVCCCVRADGREEVEIEEDWECEYAHTLLELMYHPQVYKTGLCDHFAEDNVEKWKCVWKRR
jgi:hypothetical protein